MMPTKNYTQSWMPSIFNDFFNNDFVMKANATAPSINVIDNEKDFEVELAAPGMTKKDFNIHLNDDGDLVINMEKKEENKEEKKDRKYLRREFSYSKYEQTLVLPDNVDKKSIHAEVKDGVLTITLPKLVEEPAKVNREIEVH